MKYFKIKEEEQMKLSQANSKSFIAKIISIWSQIIES